ncbi:unnamed protein product, partial [Urochloa humidicola]
SLAPFPFQFPTHPAPRFPTTSSELPLPCSVPAATTAAMAAANQLNALLNNMFATGLLDEQFQQLKLLQDPSAPDFVSEVVTLFCQDGERIIAELAKLLEKPTVDFDRVDAFVHQLKGSSASVGAQKVKYTCVQFREFCQQKSRDGCLKTLESVKTEFYNVRGKFETMLQLEKQMQGFYPK